MKYTTPESQMAERIETIIRLVGFCILIGSVAYVGGWGWVGIVIGGLAFIPNKYYD